MHKMIPLAALLAITPAVVQAADGPSYRYFEAGVANARDQQGYIDVQNGTGGYLRGSWNIGKTTHVFGSYSRVSKDWRLPYFNTRNTFQQAELGLGWHRGMSDRVDFTADIAVIRQENANHIFDFLPVDGGDPVNGKWTYTRDAGRATLGLRGMPSPRTEAWVRAGAMDGSKMNGVFYGTLGGQLTFDRTWSVVGEAQWTGSATALYMAGIRASF